MDASEHGTSWPEGVRHCVCKFMATTRELYSASSWPRPLARFVHCWTSLTKILSTRPHPPPTRLKFVGVGHYVCQFVAPTHLRACSSACNFCLRTSATSLRRRSRSASASSALPFGVPFSWPSRLLRKEGKVKIRLSNVILFAKHAYRRRLKIWVIQHVKKTCKRIFTLCQSD